MPKPKVTTVAPPPKREKPATPPQEAQTSQNLHKHASGSIVQMKFDVSHEFRKEFKLYATGRDMTVKELFERAYEYYRKAHG